MLVNSSDYVQLSINEIKAMELHRAKVRDATQERIRLMWRVIRKLTNNDKKLIADLLYEAAEE